MFDQLQVLKYYLYYRHFLHFSTRKKLMRWQAKKLRRHLSFVGKHTKIYQGMTSLKEYPLADKEFMMRHFNELNTVEVRRKEAEAFAIKAERDRNFQPKLHGVTVGLSSGTSGRRGIFLVSDRERLRWAGYILAKFLPGSIFHTYSIAFFMRADSNLYESLGSRRIQFHFFDIYQEMESHRDRLCQLQPDILVGQPSVLLQIAEDRKQGACELTPRVVISIAEVLERDQEERLKQAFGVSIIHQVYQCTEGFLAATCSKGTLHLNEDIVHIDREYLDERRFAPIVTDFERKAQPIIRYRLNDILIEKKRTCSCGSPCLALEKIEGREDDVFYFAGKNGKKQMVFPDFIRRCVLFGDTRDMNLKSDYRVVQNTDGSIVICGDWNRDEKKRIEQEFFQLAEDRDLILPKIVFHPCACELGRKMKRVERKRDEKESRKEKKNENT
ncbi:MAG: hypothetical protein HFG54_12190 [Lachnospiraceae bacterium]|nr:hypothetical protein [Lachnospiraceae bacterium]